MSWSPIINPYYHSVPGAGDRADAGVMDPVVHGPLHFEQSRSPESERANNGAQIESPNTSGSDRHVDERQSSVGTSVSVPAPSAKYAEQSTKDKEKDRLSVPSACVQCRDKHLKCDGLQPCSRCLANTFECKYVKSRRGYKGPRKNTNASTKYSATATAVSAVQAPNAHVPTPLQVTPPGACPLVHPHGASRATGAAASSTTVPSGLVTPPEKNTLAAIDLAPYDIGQELVTFEAKTTPGLEMREKCIEAFFFHFYPAHPFLLPRTEFMALRKTHPIRHLEAAVRYVGSMYIEKAPTTALELEAERAVYDVDCVGDGYRVQALLLLTIGLDGYTFQEKALQYLVDAQDLALKLGMNQRAFASTHGSGSVVLEESWRRTWWELYIVDGMIAGVHQKSSFRLNEVESSVLLPCEEREYTTGQIPAPHSMRDFDDESFDGQDFSYSSFTYRIVAMRNLGRVLAARKIDGQDEAAINRVDAYIVNWKLHLPESKKTMISNDGYLDEILFQAHMITEASTILLHRELSQLDSFPARHITSCAPHLPIPAGSTYNHHAASTIAAAQSVSHLITLPVSLAKHTHFFTCVVTLASIVHLSCWAALLPLYQDDDLKQQLRLNTGALRTLWQIWPSAGMAFGQVKGVAREIFLSKKRAAEVGYWANFSSDEVMRSVVEDQGYMEELQLL